MIKARRIGHITLDTPDLEKMVEYHTRVNGLVLASGEQDRVFFAARTGQLAIELRCAAQAKCAKISFEVAPGEDFGDMQGRLTAFGVRSEMRSDAVPGIPTALAFEDPKGSRIELFTE